MDENAKTSSGFPYKTLIWALFAVVALFLFRNELKGLLNRSEELSLFGINVKTSEGEIAKLTDSIQIHQDRILSLVEEVEGQEEEIAKLKQLKDQLARQASNCPGIENNTKLLNAEYGRILRNNSIIKKKADELKSVKMITDFKSVQN